MIKGLENISYKETNKYRRIIYFPKLKVKKWRDQWLNILSWWNMITENFSTRKHKDNNPLLLFFPNNTNISVGWFWFPVISILMPQNPFLKVISDLHMILILSVRKRNSWAISAIIICWKLHPEDWQLKFQVVTMRLPSKHLKIHDAQSWPEVSPSKQFANFLHFWSTSPHRVSQNWRNAVIHIL